MFVDHEKDDWQTEEVGGEEVSTRRHRLIFTLELLPPDREFPIGRTGNVAFLGAPAGHVWCESLLISRACEVA